MSQTKVPSTLIVHDTVYHRQSGGPPASACCRYQRVLKSQEQPYVRQMEIGPLTKKLETGWLNSVSMMVVENRGKHRVRLLFHGEPFGIVSPGSSSRFEPHELAHFEVDCPGGETAIVLYLFPE